MDNFLKIKEIYKRIIDGVDFWTIIAPPYSGRSTIEKEVLKDREIMGKKGVIWKIVDLPAEDELENLSDLLTENKIVVFVVNSLDSVTSEIRSRNYRKILDFYFQNRGKVRIVLGQGCEEIGDGKYWLDELYGKYLINRTWLSVGTGDKFEEIMGKICPKYKDLKVEKKKIIIDWSGGYVVLGKVLCENLELTESIEKCVENNQILFYLETLWDCCSEESQKCLVDIVSGRKPEKLTEYLENTGIVNKGKIFSPLMRLWIGRIMEESIWEIVERDGVWWIGEKNIKDELTYQEYQLFDLLMKRRGVIVSRDEVAETIWGEKSEEKYSDWAIDQLVSKIRRKIGDFGKQRIIRAIKGKGFVIEK